MAYSLRLCHHQSAQVAHLVYRVCLHYCPNQKTPPQLVLELCLFLFHLEYAASFWLWLLVHQYFADR